MRYILAAFLALSIMAGCLPPWPGVDTGDPVVDTEVDTDTDSDSDTDTDVDTDSDTDSDTDTDTDADTDSDTDTDTDTDTGDTGIGPVDVDDDGWTVEEGDCNDEDAAINPDAAEYCDGVDNDCDSMIDEADAADATIWFFDSDEDGYGDPDVYEVACDQPPGFVEDDTDCNDADAAYHPGATEDDCTDPNDYNCDGSSGLTDADTDGWAACEDCDDLDAAINPGAAEVCDDVDQDCDSVADDGLATTVQHLDYDGDGYGDASVSVEYCDAVAGYVEDATDCNDADSSVHPGATEICDDLDQDCDDVADNGLATTVQYLDSDGDGFGNALVSAEDCAALEGYVEDATDCDDTDAAINPDEVEICDSVDQDCDGTADNGLATTIQYLDFDGDGFGDVSVSIEYCDAVAGYVEDATDCDDADTTINPDADEYCDTVDNDCDGTIDEADALDVTTWYVDSDSDGYGSSAVTQDACDQPTGYVEDVTDCDDTDSSVHPGATEVCDDVDQDCDSVADNGLATTVQYQDLDDDGFGNTSVSIEYCATVAGYVEDDSDCDDTDAEINPGAEEICDSLDNDCDDATDEGFTYYVGWPDEDSDGFGDPDGTQASGCPDSKPDDYVTNDDDCDDTDVTIYPGATEVCDGVDQDCDGTADDGLIYTQYQDADSDGYGNASVLAEDCEALTGYVTDSTDCDDTNAAYHPGADESSCSDPADYNCDGSTGYTDADSDGWAACEDCDDTDDTVYPGATEVCDGVDQDCDSVVDNDLLITQSPDADSDGYGDALISVEACTVAEGYVEDDSDCNDAVATINPGATEVCDGVDQDCDSVVDDGLAVTTQYQDSDSDSFGNALVLVEDCTAHSGYVTNDDDCNDGDADIHPGATETCDGVDEDCDGTADDGLVYTQYQDADSDGYGNASVSDEDCETLAGYVTDSSDCDDTDSSAHPGAVEICDEIDNDCNGTIDDTWDCEDVDGDGIVNSEDWIVLMDADGDGGTDACIPGFLALDSPFSETSAYIQFGNSSHSLPYTSLVSLRALNGDVDDDGVMDSWCVTTDDFAYTTGAEAFRFVSSLSAADSSRTASTTDCADWEIPDFTAYCVAYGDCCQYDTTWDGCSHVKWVPYIHDNGTDLSCP